MNTIYLKIEDDDIVILDEDIEIIRADFKSTPQDVADAILTYFHYQRLIEYVNENDTGE